MQRKFILKEPIEKGWSCDKKFCVTDGAGIECIFFNIFPASRPSSYCIEWSRRGTALSASSPSIHDDKIYTPSLHLPSSIGLHSANLICRAWGTASACEKMLLYGGKMQRKFILKEPIEKGWSCDKKFCVTDSGGIKYLLRITPEEKSTSRADMFRMQKAVEALGIPMCRPIEYGRCREGVYILSSWIDGEDADISQAEAVPQALQIKFAPTRFQTPA